MRRRDRGGAAGRDGSALGRAAPAARTHAPTASEDRARAPQRRGRASSGRPVERPPAHQVDVQVVDRLAAPPPDVRDQPVARRRRCPAVARESGGDREEPAEQRAVRLGQLGRRRDVAARDEQDVGRRARRDVAEGDDEVVLVERGRTGSSPATIRQNRQSAATAPSVGSPEHRLRAHQEPDRADQPGHQVRHVALPLRPLQPRLVVGGGPDADQAAQVRALDEERDRRG